MLHPVRRNPGDATGTRTLLTGADEEDGVSVGVRQSQSGGGEIVLRVVDRHAI